MSPRPDDRSNNPPAKRGALLEASSTSPSTLSSDGSTDDSQEATTSGVAEEPKSTGYFFLSPTARHHLPLFQYCGQDLSLLYNYVLSPLAGHLVLMLPRHVAPNTITLVGLLFMVSSYGIFWCYSPDLTADPADLPRWMFLWNCVSMLLYQTFDNMDGKQARRTNSTSPLGLLFDHGCDAVNSLFGSVNWIIAMALNPRLDTWACWILLLGPYSLFFIGTWEEYYSGKLLLPFVNGPNEGLLGGAMLSLMSYWYGPQYWQLDTWSAALEPYLGASMRALPRLRNADWVILASSLGFVQECFIKIGTVMRRHGLRVAVTLSPFLILLVGSCTLMVFNERYWLTSPRTVLHLLASLFVEMTTALMLAHMSKTRYQPWRWTLLPLIALVAATVWEVGLSIELVVWYAAASCTYLAMKSCLIVHEICELLQIWCFDITNPRTPRKAEKGHLV